MHALLARVPRMATRYVDGGLKEVSIDDVLPGDLLLIRQGDVVPVDGTVASPHAVLNMSALTGESLPVSASKDDAVLSGCLNQCRRCLRPRGDP